MSIFNGDPTNFCPSLNILVKGGHVGILCVHLHRQRWPYGSFPPARARAAAMLERPTTRREKDAARQRRSRQRRKEGLLVATVAVRELPLIEALIRSQR